MKLSIIGSTRPGFELPTEQALIFSGHEAGICYMPEDINTLLSEPDETALRRANGTLKSGHHSVMGHASYNFVIEGAPKIIAMLLNNEQEYYTSEKSARYTTMKTTDQEQKIYEKWITKFETLISKKYPQIDKKVVHKLALENARYFISVFTPSTVMGYTVNLRQANYLIKWCKDLAFSNCENPFLEQLSPFLIELASLLTQKISVNNLYDNQGRSFTLFSNRKREDEFGENYCISYEGTFSQLAQAQRHRSLYYEMQIPDSANAKFYIPPIISSSEDRDEYLVDMNQLASRFPQGMLVKINERGTAENFCKKCHERLCGAAQREICIRTHDTLELYLRQAEGRNPEIHQLLSKFKDKTKCQFGHYQCDRPCPLGPAMAFERLI